MFVFRNVLLLTLLNLVAFQPQLLGASQSQDGDGNEIEDDCADVLPEVELDWAECTQHEELNHNSASCLSVIIQAYNLTQKIATDEWPPKARQADPSEEEEEAQNAEITTMLDSYASEFDEAIRLLSEPSSRERGRLIFEDLQQRVTTIVANMEPSQKATEQLLNTASLASVCGNIYYKKLANTGKMKTFIEGCVSCLFQQDLFPKSVNVSDLNWNSEDGLELDLRILQQYHQLITKLNTLSLTWKRMEHVTVDDTAEMLKNDGAVSSQLRGVNVAELETIVDLSRVSKIEFPEYINQSDVNYTLSRLVPVMGLRLEKFQPLIQKEADNYQQNLQIDADRQTYLRRSFNFVSAAIQRLKSAEAKAEVEYRRYFEYGADKAESMDNMWAALKQVMNVLIAIVVFIISFSMVGLGPINF